MNKKLFIFLEDCGISNVYCCKNYEEFRNEVISSYSNAETEEELIKELEFLDNSPYSKFYELENDTILKFTNDLDGDGISSNFPDSLLYLKKGDDIAVSEILKHCDYGFLGYEIFWFA